jgi:glutamyl-Q tRNA(Asp) synthetase
LHIGHATAAAVVFDFARSHNGTALLRIEDIDHTRCRPEYTDGIYEDLAWLGYTWPTPVRVQSAHYADYAAVVSDLVRKGLAYACTLTRSEIKAGYIPQRNIHPQFTMKDQAKWSEQSLHQFDNDDARVFCQVLHASSYTKNPDLPFVIRLDVQRALEYVSDQSLAYCGLNDPDDLETYETLDARPVLTEWVASTRPDPIIARRDIGCSYHIAVTHDDHLQSISHVVRGADFIDQTPLHVLIQTLMGWRTPTYYHHPLITDASGRKLSKSARDLTLKSLRESGSLPTDVLSHGLNGADGAV